MEYINMLYKIDFTKEKKVLLPLHFTAISGFCMVIFITVRSLFLYTFHTGNKKPTVHIS